MTINKTDIESDRIRGKIELILRDFDFVKTGRRTGAINGLDIASRDIEKVINKANRQYGRKLLKKVLEIVQNKKIPIEPELVNWKWVKVPRYNRAMNEIIREVRSINDNNDRSKK